MLESQNSTSASSGVPLNIDFFFGLAPRTEALHGISKLNAQQLVQ